MVNGGQENCQKLHCGAWRLNRLSSMHIPPAADSEATALGEIHRLARLDDGSGIIEAQLIDYLDSLGEDAFERPSLRIAGQTLLGEVLTGLGEDACVAQVLSRNVADSQIRPGMTEAAALQARAAQIVVIRLLRVIARMEAVELREDILTQLRCPYLPEPVRVALSLTEAVLAAAALDGHPDDMVRVVLSFADQVVWLGDWELLDYFAELESQVEQREAALRFGQPNSA